MRLITLVLAYLAVAMARPQFRLTEKEYEGFQAGLDGRIPVAITSGQLLYSAVDESPNNFVVVDFGGAGPAAPRIPEVGDSGEVGAGINDFGQGVLAFGQGVVQFASQAVGDIVDGIGQVAEDTFALLGSGEDDFDVDRTLISAPPQLPLDVTDVEARAVIIVDDTAGAPVSVDESAAVAAGINDFGQGVLAFGQGVAAFASQAVGDLGKVAEDTLQGIADLVGDERSFAAGRAGGVPLPLDVIAAEPTAVIVLDALPEAALPVFESGVASFRSLETVTVPAVDVVSAAASTPEPSTAAGIETTSAVADTTTAAVSAATSSTVTEAVSTSTSAVTVAAPEVAAAVPVADLRSASVVAEDTAVAPAAPEEAIVAPPPAVTEAVPTSTVSTVEVVTTSAVTEAVVASSTAVAEPIDDTLNEIVPAAPKAEENANAPVDIEKSAVVPATDLLSAPAAVEDAAAVPIAESRSAPVAAEDTALAPAAPEEAIVAPPATVAVGVALIRRKRQFVDAEEPISNAKSIGTGLGTGFGLFGPQ